MIRNYITGKQGGLILQYLCDELKTENIKIIVVANQRELEDKWMDSGSVLLWTEN